MIKLISTTATLAILLTSSAATARNSDHSDFLLGPSHLTCDKFNKLAKVEKGKVMAWALGYVSGMVTSNAEEVRMARQAGEEREDVKPIYERKLVAQIRQQCLLRPDVFFPLIVEWAAAEM
jgi:HdeA/HdeB family